MLYGSIPQILPKKTLQTLYKPLDYFRGAGAGAPWGAPPGCRPGCMRLPLDRIVSHDDARIAAKMGIQTYMKLRLAKETINIKAQLGRRPKNHMRYPRGVAKPSSTALPLKGWNQESTRVKLSLFPASCSLTMSSEVTVVRFSLVL